MYMRASEMPFIFTWVVGPQELRGASTDLGVRYGDPCGWIGAVASVVQSIDELRRMVALGNAMLVDTPAEKIEALHSLSGEDLLPGRLMTPRPSETD